MTATRSLLLLGISLLLFSSFVLGDIYMQNPAGSNNRNCERQDTTRNQNRLYNSQNNNNGGYNCPRPHGGDEVEEKRMYYYEGSILPIQWTNQHSCGANNTQCSVVIQYSCEDTAPGMRDGTPTTSNTNTAEGSATNTIPEDEDEQKKTIYGQHETYDYYKKCKTRRRNLGLWIADRNVNERGSATRTRQNENGNRYGFECPEERDYYPYWHPTPWKDVAIFTWNATMCDYYQYFSENNLGRGECITKEGKPSENNNPSSCQTEGHDWVVRDAHNIAPPECIDATTTIVSRDNHLGNVLGGDMATYNWTIPYLPEGVDGYDRCVVRIRYNITTDEVRFNETDYKFNGDSSPLKQDPVIDIGAGFPIELTVNTNQNSRTFQDRSYTFQIKKRPEKVTLGDGEEVRLDKNAPIYNIGVRGKRGNIVQTYPSLEYDFVPNWLSLRGGDWVHIQWTGSDYNPPRAPNNAEGGPPIGTDNNANSGADRSNFVQAASLGRLDPVPVSNFTFFKVPPRGDVDESLAKKLVLLEQDLSTCMTTEDLKKEAINNNNEDNAQRDRRNCGKLSGQKHPYIDFGLFQVNSNGRFTFMSTRNNNFSNRRHIMQIEVTGGRWNSAGTIRASIAMSALMMLAVVLAIF